jgi:hypothetical protein
LSLPEKRLESPLLQLTGGVSHLIAFNMMLRKINIFVRKGTFCPYGHAGNVKRNMFIELMLRLAIHVQ